MKKRSPRRYNVREREAALLLAAELGLTGAASKLGIPMPTVSEWMRRKRQEEQSDALRDEWVTKKAGPRRYAVGEREEAIMLAGEIGLGAAASKLGVPEKTVSGWLRRQRAMTSGGDAGATPPVAGAKVVQSERQIAKVYTPSERARAIEFAAQEGVSAAAIKYGISRFSIYEWQRKTRLHAAGKASDSPVVGSDENRVAARDHRILSEWKTHPGLGPSQVRNQLRRQGFKVSLHTVRCVLEENGYVTPKVRRVTVHDQRYEAVRPNHLWHLDFLHRYINKQPVYVLLILDDYSRFIVGAGLWDGERVVAVQETFLAAVNRHGTPEKTMSDGGSAFYSWRGVGAFTHLHDELEIDQIIAKTPQNNGKLEALNANIQKELFDRQKFFDLGEAQRYLANWIHTYNFRRTHHALGGLLVPADRYFGRADEVLACIESGRSMDGVGEPLSPSERQLDLFRITSQRGQVEIHLLGHRILLREEQ